MIAECTKRIAVVGMGNLLMCDDGVGVHVLKTLSLDHREDLLLIDAGTNILHTADCLRGMEHIVVIDALEGGGKPGTVYRMNGEDVEENDFSLSVHSLGLKSALRFLTCNEEQVEWTLIGIEPETLQSGTELSAAVKTAIPRAADAVKLLLEEWEQ